MKTRHCPCCNETISFKAFATQLMSSNKRLARSGKKPGIVCSGCGRPLVCSEQKNRFFAPILIFAFLPVLLVTATAPAILNSGNYLYFMLYLLAGLGVAFALLLKAYRTVTLSCDDKPCMPPLEGTASYF